MIRYSVLPTPFHVSMQGPLILKVLEHFAHFIFYFPVTCYKALFLEVLKCQRKDGNCHCEVGTRIAVLEEHHDGGDESGVDSEFLDLRSEKHVGGGE